MPTVASVRWFTAFSALVCAVASAADVRFEASFAGSVRSSPAVGRLVVFLQREGADLPPGATPLDGPFWDDPQPLFATDVGNAAGTQAGAKPGDVLIVDDRADGFLGRARGKPSELPPGKYVAQAVLNTGFKMVSSWRRADGSLFTRVPVAFEIVANADAPLVVKIPLDAVNTVPPRKSAPGIEYVEFRSALLSTFHGRDVMLRAGVVLPEGYDPAATNQFAAVYEVPGFGGDDRGASGHAQRLARDTNEKSAERELHRRAFWIVLDPESPNGHTLFADSANNGPCGEALIKELIPALESRYRLKTAATHRLLRGHSSGGWSTLWLAITYPDTFGACWSTAPDPVCFEQFQSINMYKDDNAFIDASGQERPSVRRAGKRPLSVREESGAEDVLGPDNTSGGQWDSWQAVACPRNLRGNPAALWDPATGKIDHAIAEASAKYDIVRLVRASPGVLGPIFKQRIRLVVGDQDNFFLENAVRILKPEIDNLSFLTLPEGSHGSIEILPGFDHGSIFGSPRVRGFAREMIEHLNRVDGLASAKPAE